MKIRINILISKYKKYSKFIYQIAFYIIILCIPISFTLCKKNKISDEQSDFFVKFFGVSGKNLGSDVCQTNDGGYVLIGTTSIPEKGTDITLIKTDKFGNQEWSKTFGDSLDDYAKSVRITADGGFIILGTTTSNNSTALQKDMYLIKTDNQGNISWSYPYGGDSTDQEGNCVQQTTDNGFILIGYTTDANPANLNPSGEKDILLIKTDVSGSLLWSRSSGGKKADVGNYVQQKSDGGYIIIGSSESAIETGKDKSNIIILKTNQNGIETGAKYYGDMFDDYGECIQILSDNNFIITGTFGYPDNTRGMYIAKFQGDNIQEPLWTNIIEKSSATFGKYIQETSDKGFILTGTSEKPGNKDICLVKLLSDGTIDFTKYFGEIGGEEDGNAVKQTSDGGFIIAGTNSFEGPSMITLIKTNAKGEQK